MGTRIKGYHLNNNDGFHDSHYPIYDPEGFCSHQEMDDILRAIAQYTPQAHLVLEDAPDGRATTPVIHSDIRRVVQITESL